MSLDLNRSLEEVEQTIEQQEKRARLSGNVGCIIISIIVLAGLIFVGYKIYEAGHQTAQLNTSSVKTEAQVSQVTMSFSWAMGDAYLVRYNFAVNNQTYSGEASFAERPASKVVVEYDPENPNNNRAEAGLGWSPISIKNLIWFGVATLVLFVVGFIKAAFDYFFRGKSV